MGGAVRHEPDCNRPWRCLNYRGVELPPGVALLPVPPELLDPLAALDLLRLFFDLFVVVPLPLALFCVPDCEFCMVPLAPLGPFPLLGD